MKLLITTAMVVAGIKIVAMMFTQFLWCLSISRNLEMVLWPIAGVFVVVGWAKIAEWIRCM